MNSREYMDLSGSAAKLLQELCYQLTDCNNGDLTLAFSVLQQRGWRSRATVERARDELLQADLIQQTRQGRFLNPGGICSLYGVTWLKIHESRRNLDIAATREPKRNQKSFQNTAPRI
ncbi:MAG: hypothetical protein AAF756_02290 [Pseudomonadota bacterium]